MEGVLVKLPDVIVTECGPAPGLPGSAMYLPSSHAVLLSPAANSVCSPQNLTGYVLHVFCMAMTQPGFPPPTQPAAVSIFSGSKMMIHAMESCCPLEAAIINCPFCIALTP